MEISVFQRLILEWGRDHRRDMPWRNTRDPYKILVSEVMLQQTQVSRVIPKYEAFLREFPTLEALADASQPSLLRIWQGLGYWNRALRLRDAARMIVNEFDGEFPRDPAALMQLPGVGPYTAGALACFAFGCAEPFLDTNIRRVYLYFFFPGEDDVPDSRIMEVARRAVWTEDPREWGYALFDYGATELRDRAINRRSRHYSRQPAFEGSFRSFRTQALRHVLAQENTSLSRAELKGFLSQRLATGDYPYTPQDVMDALVDDGLLKISLDDRVFI